MLLMSVAVVAAEPASAKRFSLTGGGALSRDATTLSDGKLSMRGYLQSNDAPSTAATVQEGSHFVIMAHAVALAQVCYNDTIFRDDFDGDGF
jgi:hypothetical protein